MVIEGKTLGVGFDDSNHAGSSKGEIVVATFSFLDEDRLVREFSMTRNYPFALSAIQEDGRDYRFTVLTAERYRHSSLNLPRVAPYLVRNYLRTCRNFSRLCLYFDGRMDITSKQMLREEFREFPEVVIANFIKKQDGGNRLVRDSNRRIRKKRVLKRMRCPRLVWLADNLASGFNSEYTFEDLVSDEKMVVII